jgi:aspartate/methionine/tyrosine aminotransferase
LLLGLFTSGYPGGDLKSIPFKNLTGFEIDTLPHAFNLTDGHAFRSWSPKESAVISRASDLFQNIDRRSQSRLEQEYIADFLALGKQTNDPSSVAYLMCFTASMAFEVVANWLRLKRWTVTLIEPAFDNLADIFRRHEIPLHSFADELLEAAPEIFEARIRQIEDHCICLVTPNNPTGLTLSEANLRILAKFCKDTGKLLILDNCFRAYLPREQLCDQYRILIESGADFVMVEDTGKTWPTAEIKAPFFAVSRARDFFQQIYDIYTDFLLHISPVGVKLVHQFIRLSQEDDLEKIREVVRVNRQALYRSLQGTFLTPCEKEFASVAWLRIDAPISGPELKQMLDEQGVYVLAGSHFYWSDHSRGDGYIRIALTRDADVFAQAAERLGRICRRFMIKKDVRRELVEQGFSMIAAKDWVIPPDLAPHWENLRSDWHVLELDHHLKNGATFRRRRYGRYFWSPGENILRSLPNEAYFQPEDQNGYAGGVQRAFAPLLPESVENPFLLELVRCSFGQLPLDDVRAKQNWEVRVHQIRIVATPNEVGEPAPEGIHQDGTDFLTLHLVRRENVKGAQSTIYDLDRKPIFNYTMSDVMDSFILEDPRIMHGVTPVVPADGCSPATRDLLGIDFIFNPTLEAPAS